MNAKVTTYWMFGKTPITQVMPEERVEAYLANCRSSGTMKGYIVDAVPTEIQPRVPIGTRRTVTIELTEYEAFIVKKALKGFAKNTAKDQGLAATSFTRGLLDDSQEQTALSVLSKLEDQ